MVENQWIYWRHKGDKTWSRSLVHAIDGDMVHLKRDRWHTQNHLIVCILEIDWKENRVDSND